MSMWPQPQQPNLNPGSPRSKATGCLCPIVPNNAGSSAPIPPDGWWLHTECPHHKARLVLGKVDIG